MYQDVILNNTVSENVKLGDTASRVGENRFASSVNNSDLWDDDLTNRASLLLLVRIFHSTQGGCQEPQWGLRVMMESSCSVAHFRIIHEHTLTLFIAEGRDQVGMEFSSLLAAKYNSSLCQSSAYSVIQPKTLQRAYLDTGGKVGACIQVGI